MLRRTLPSFILIAPQVQDHIGATTILTQGGKDGTPSNKLLSSHVSIRNTDTRKAIQLLYVRYYDTEGKLIKNFLAAPAMMLPLATIEFFVPRSDTSGGSGANFIIGWKNENQANPPLVQAVHADIDMSRTLIFTTEARPTQIR
jgi:hypothetical protein